MNPYSMFQTTPYANDYWGAGGNLMLPSGNANQFFQYRQPGEQQPPPGGLLQGPGFRQSQGIADGSLSLLNPSVTQPVLQAPQQGGNGLGLSGDMGYGYNGQWYPNVEDAMQAWSPHINASLAAKSHRDFYEAQRAAGIPKFSDTSHAQYRSPDDYIANIFGAKPQTQQQFLGINS